MVFTIAVAIMTILVGLNFSASEITDILFENITDTKTGVILLKYNDNWVTICHHGEPNTWGKREAIVACTQLGFTGGWPLEVSRPDTDGQPLHLNNFDCDGTEAEMKDCGYEIADECKDSNIAGVQCYSTFGVNLVGGMIPSMGRLEVSYDDVWSNVCYDSKESETRQWNIYNVQVVCRQLGFAGAISAKRGGVGIGTWPSIVDGYKCREDLRDDSLQECLPDIPIMLPDDYHDSPCDYGTTGDDNYAVAICAVPGYTGCFKDNAYNTLTKFSASNMTTQICRKDCRNHNYTHAYLSNGDTCYCGALIGHGRVSDTECREECRGDIYQVCGGIGNNTLSVYDVNEGMCDDLWNKSEIYYYGQILDDLCEPGMEPVTAKVIQCVELGSSGGMGWNDTLPKCKAAVVNGDNNGDKDVKVGLSQTDIVIIASIGSLVIVLLPALVLLLWKCRKRKPYIRHEEMRGNTSTQCDTSEELLNPPSEEVSPQPHHEMSSPNIEDDKDKPFTEKIRSFVTSVLSSNAGAVQFNANDCETSDTNTDQTLINSGRLSKNDHEMGSVTGQESTGDATIEEENKRWFNKDGKKGNKTTKGEQGNKIRAHANLQDTDPNKVTGTSSTKTKDAEDIESAASNTNTTPSMTTDTGRTKKRRDDSNTKDNETKDKSAIVAENPDTNVSKEKKGKVVSLKGASSSDQHAVTGNRGERSRHTDKPELESEAEDHDHVETTKGKPILECVMS